MAEQPLVVAITGASGYVGQIAKQRLRSEGLSILELVRARPERALRPDQRLFALERPLSSELLAGVDVLVHTAWDLRVTKPADAWRINVEGTVALLDQARRAQVGRVVFVSSMSAYDGVKQLYGLTKLECERLVLGQGGAVLRPGLVYGPSPGGMVGALDKMTRLPVVPVVAAQASQFTVHEADLADAFVAVLRSSALPKGPIGVASSYPIAFRELLEAIAVARARRPVFVPVPWWVVFGCLRLGEAAGLRLPFRSDSLLGLVHPPRSVPNQDWLAENGVQCRPFAPAV